MTEETSPNLKTRIEAVPSRDLPARATVPEPQWHVLWTRSNCEQLVEGQLAAKGFEVFLPRIEQWSGRGSSRGRARIPMFPGYLFLRAAVDMTSYVEVSKARGLVRILGSAWNRLAAVPREEIEAIEKTVRSHLPAMPYPYLKHGQRVRITRGPLVGVEGIFVHSEPRTGLLVLSVELLRRSLAVHVDCTTVAPA
jgi:transcription antitermination factor NusG